MPARKYPHAFLGRCSTCLDNAFLNDDPCPFGHGNGMPIREEDCLTRACQKAHDKLPSASTLR